MASSGISTLCSTAIAWARASIEVALGVDAVDSRETIGHVLH